MGKSHLLNQLGNINDMRSSIRCNWQRIKPDSIKKAIRNEKANQNRKSFIALLEGSLRKKVADTKKITSLKPGSKVMVEIDTGGKTEWIDAKISSQTAFGPKVITFYGREFGPCAIECIQIVRAKKGGTDEV